MPLRLDRPFTNQLELNEAMHLVVTLFNPKNPKRFVRTRAFLDTGATTSCVRESVLRDGLGLRSTDWDLVWAAGIAREKKARVYRVGMTVHGDNFQDVTFSVMRVFGLDSSP